ncbi:MAG: hypothetical protein PHG58_01540 [Clostridia bacterium]|nr:hypothetical protein [Clostridia bacterium]
MNKLDKNLSERYKQSTKLVQSTGKPRNLTIPSVILFVSGYLIYTALSGTLYFVALKNSLDSGVVFPIILGLGFIGYIVECIREFICFVKSDKTIAVWSKEDIFKILSVVISSIVTFLISGDLGMNTIIASALVGLIAALIIPKFSGEIFCGSFVGMVSHMLIGNIFYLLLAGLVAGIVFVIIGNRVFQGFGGKMGASAFSACVIMLLLNGKRITGAAITESEVIALILVFSVLSAVLTYSISVRLKFGPVLASSIIGLIGGLILPIVYLEYGNILAAVNFCASFSGMAAKERFPNELSMILVGFITGLIFIFSYTFMVGAGGKLGTIALASNIACAGMISIFAAVKRKISRLTEIVSQ